MKNIIIIAPKNKEKCGLIMEVIERIKKDTPEVSVSVLVSLDNYYVYYNNPCIDGLLITPKSILSRLFTLPKNHYDIALDFQNSLIWSLSIYIADIKNRLKVNRATDINEKQVQKVLQIVCKACN